MIINNLLFRENLTDIGVSVKGVVADDQFGNVMSKKSTYFILLLLSDMLNIVAGFEFYREFALFSCKFILLYGTKKVNRLTGGFGPVSYVLASAIAENSVLSSR